MTLLRAPARLFLPATIAAACSLSCAAPPAGDDAWIRTLSKDQLWALSLPVQATTQALRRSLAPLQHEISGELASRLDFSEQTPDATVGRYRLYTVTPKGSFYPRLYRTALDRPHEPPALLLDLGKLAAATGFVDLGGYALTDDGRYLAYSVDTSGSRSYQLRLRDLAGGGERRVPGPNVSSFDFSPDGRALYVVDTDAAKRPWQVRRVDLGTLASDVIYSERDPAFRVSVSMSGSGRFLQVVASSSSTSEAWLRDERGDDHRLRLVLPRRDGVYYDIDDWRGEIYVRSNEQDNAYGLYRLDLDHLGDHAALATVVAPRRDRLITSMKAFERALVVSTREDGVSQVRRLSAPDGDLQPLATPAGATSLELGVNTDYRAPDVKLLASSFTMPLTVAAAPLDGGPWRPVFVARTPASFRQDDYCQGSWTARSDDGTRVPIPYVFRGRCDQPPRDRPLLLSVYGAYGVVSTAGFSLNRLSLLDRGFVVALAQVRGGGEFGDDWYYAGRGCAKRRGIEDFEAALRWLHAAGVARPERTVISGQSAGGVIVGMTVDEAPQLAAAAVINGGFLDVEATMRRPDLPNTLPEFQEWGDPNDPAQVQCMRAFDPMQNVRQERVPRLLVRTGLQDEQVSPAESIRFVRRLRGAASNGQDVFLDVARDSGHDGPSDAHKYFESLAFELAFMVQSTAPAALHAGAEPGPPAPGTGSVTGARLAP